MSAPLTFGTEGPEDQTFGYELGVVPKAGIGDQAKGPTDDRSPESVDDQLGDLAGFAESMDLALSLLNTPTGAAGSGFGFDFDPVAGGTEAAAGGAEGGACLVPDAEAAQLASKLQKRAETQTQPNK